MSICLKAACTENQFIINCGYYYGCVLTAEPAARLVVPRVLKKTCAPVQSWRTVSSETESRSSICWLSLPALSSAATSTPGSSSNLRRDSSVTLPTVSYKNGAVSTIIATVGWRSIRRPATNNPQARRRCVAIIMKHCSMIFTLDWRRQETSGFPQAPVAPITTACILSQSLVSLHFYNDEIETPRPKALCLLRMRTYQYTKRKIIILLLVHVKWSRWISGGTVSCHKCGGQSEEKKELCI